MALDANGEWDGYCACGKKEADGQRCFLGATHQNTINQPMPWAISSTVASAEASSPKLVQWSQRLISVVWDDGDGGEIIYPMDASYLSKRLPWQK